MIDNLYNLAISERAKQAIEAGLAFRQGGVVRWNEGKILEILQDATLLKEATPVATSLLGASVVPMVIFSASMIAINHRLSKIENTLQELQLMLKEAISKIELINIKIDSSLIGKVNGLIHACSIDILEGRTHRFESYRQSFLENYHVLHQICNLMSKSSENLKNHFEILKNYMQAMLLTGIAARDLCYRIGENSTALFISEKISKDIENLEATMYENINSIPALIWRNDDHIDLVLEARESKERLKSHVCMLENLPHNNLQQILVNQINN